MSTNKTPNMDMHSWVGADKVLRSEFVDNFTEIDKKFHPTTGHKHNGLAGQAPKIEAADVKLNISSTSSNNVKDALDWLFLSANNILGNIAGVIGNSYNPSSDVSMHNITAQNTNLNLWKNSFINSVRNRYGVVNDADSLHDLASRIANIPYQLSPTGTAVSADVVNGKTFINSTGVIQTGSVPLQAATSIAPGTTDKIIPAGLYKKYTIAGEVNLAPENIKKGTTIYNIPGTLEWPWGVDKGGTVMASQMHEYYTLGTTPTWNNGYDGTDTNNVMCFDSQYNLVFPTKAMNGYYVKTVNRNTGIETKSFSVNIGNPVIDIACTKQHIILTTAISVTAININTGNVEWTFNKSSSSIPQASLGDFVGAKGDQDGNVFILSHFGSVIRLSSSGAALNQRQYSDGADHTFIGPFQNSLYDPIYYVNVKYCKVYQVNQMDATRALKWDRGSSVNNYAKQLVYDGQNVFIVYTTQVAGGHTYIERCAPGSAGMGRFLNSAYIGGGACNVPGKRMILVSSSTDLPLHGYGTVSGGLTMSHPIPIGAKKIIADYEGNLFISFNNVKMCYSIVHSGYRLQQF